jgi:hypothetical protein
LLSAEVYFLSNALNKSTNQQINKSTNQPLPHTHFTAEITLGPLMYQCCFYAKTRNEFIKFTGQAGGFTSLHKEKN